MSQPNMENQNNPDTQNQKPADRHEVRWERRREWRDKNPYKGLFPALVLILLGVLLFFTTRGTISWSIWWQYLLIGLGGIFLIDGFLHLLNPSIRYRGWGKFFPGIILVLVGTAFLIGFSEWWPLILVGIGVAILLGMLFKRR